MRVVWVVMDGVGCGSAPDAALYGDRGCNTLRHVAEACRGLDLPHLQALGLGNILPLPGVPPRACPQAHWGVLQETAAGKDSTSGHWELAGVTLQQPFQVYPDGFPAEIVKIFRRLAGHEPLGNVAASGTRIIQDLGAEHIASGRLILYTSTDSVMQIAAHESVFALEDLYRLCRQLRPAMDAYGIGRIIARPFTGPVDGPFTRTAGRKDFSMPPPAQTLLNFLQQAGIETVGVGKVLDLFAGDGFDEHWPTADNAAGLEAIQAWLAQGRQGLLLANLVDFDMLYGHRLDVAGFAYGLKQLDAALPAIMTYLQPGERLLLTADHGCDPTTPGTDHTREEVPLLCWGPDTEPGRYLGRRRGFGYVARYIAARFGLSFA